MGAKQWLGGGPGAILGFHAIVSPQWPSLAPMHLPASVLSAMVRVAGRMGTIVPLEDLVVRHAAGKSTAGMVALTFDDAYASLLESDFCRLEIPFAVGAVSGWLGRGAAFWWDRVEDVYPVAPAEAREVFSRELAIGHADGQAATFDQVRRHVLKEHQGRLSPRLEAAIDRLEAEAGLRTAQRSQTAEELVSLGKRPWVSVFVHTVSHPVLPLLPDDDIKKEVRESWRALQDLEVHVAPILATPYGLYDDRSVRLAQESGMLTTLTLEGRTLRRRHPGTAPRFCVMRSEAGWKLALRIGGAVEWVQSWRREDQTDSSMGEFLREEANS